MLAPNSVAQVRAQIGRWRSSYNTRRDSIDPVLRVVYEARFAILMSVVLSLLLAGPPQAIDAMRVLAEDGGWRSVGAFWIGARSTDGGTEIAGLAFVFSAEALAAFGNQIVATATDAIGNTSEFSPPLSVPEPGAAGVGTAALCGLASLRRAARGEGRRRRGC